MKFPAIIIIALSLTLTGSMLCYGGSITYGTDIQINGILKLQDSPLCFADNTCMTTAVFSDGSAIWGQITGYIDLQLDLSEKFATKEDKSQKGIPYGYAPLNGLGKISPVYLNSNVSTFTQIPVAGTTPTWKNNGSIWEPLKKADETNIFLSIATASEFLRIIYHDNVGTSGAVWCNIGIFRNDETTPICYGSWSGAYTNPVFQQVKLECVVPSNSVPCPINTQCSQPDIFTVKHRSQMCAYGNYWLDEYSTMRKFTIEEL